MRGGDLDRHVLGVDAAHSRDLPSENYGNTQHRPASAGPRVAFVHPLDSGSAHDPLPIVAYGCGAVALEAAHAARLSNLRRLLNGADQYHFRLQSSAALRFLCGGRRMGIRMIKSL